MGRVEEELDSGVVKEEAPAAEKAAVPEVAPAAEAPASGCCGGGCHEEKKA